MKKIFMAAMAVALGVPAAAQDTYESARLLGSDLNGTARYVGMGPKVVKNCKAGQVHIGDAEAYGYFETHYKASR